MPPKNVKHSKRSVKMFNTFVTLQDIKICRKRSIKSGYILYGEAWLWRDIVIELVSCSLPGVYAIKRLPLLGLGHFDLKLGRDMRFPLQSKGRNM